MRTYFEAFLRRWVVLTLPVVVGALVGGALAFMTPRTYTATSSLWVDTRVPEESTMGTSGGDSPPSQGQLTLLTQLLSTRTFLAEVLRDSSLAEEFNDADPLEEAGLMTELAQGVQVLTPGPQLLTLMVVRDDPEEAMDLNRAVIAQFEEVQLNQATARAKAQVAYDERRLEEARVTLKASRSDASEELFAEASSAYNRSLLDLAAVEATSLQSVDEPDIAYPSSRRSTIAMGTLGGMLAGATLSVLALILMMARDNTLRSEKEALDLGLLAVGTVPLVAALHRPGRQLALGRRAKGSGVATRVTTGH